MHDEWIAFPRRYLPEGSMDQIYPTEPGESSTLVTAVSQKDRVPE